MTSVMISKLELKSEGFNPKVGSTYNFSGLNPSIEDSVIEEPGKLDLRLIKH